MNRSGEPLKTCSMLSEGTRPSLGECFSAPPETVLEYVVATIDVKEQKLKLFLDNKQVTDFDYKLR
jgi:hypothetical protein